MRKGFKQKHNNRPDNTTTNLKQHSIQKHNKNNCKQKGEILIEYYRLVSDWLPHTSICGPVENRELEDVYSKKNYEPK